MSDFINNLSISSQQYIPFSARNNPFSNPADLAARDNSESLFSQMLERSAQLSSAEHRTVSIDGSSTPILPTGRAEIDRTSELFEMCQEFEFFLLKTLISSMRNTIQKTELIDTGFAGQFYEDQLYDEYTKSFAKNAGLGFAEMAYLELTGQRGKVLGQSF